jgi:hypothetical protein
MNERVISVRLPEALVRIVRESAKNAHLTVSKTVDWLVRNSFSNPQALSGLTDCPEELTSKLDVRIPIQTFEQLRTTSLTFRISISFYTRVLLYNFYVTKRVIYVKSGDRYTLAARQG